MTNNINSKLKWYHAAWTEYGTETSPDRCTCDILANSKAGARSIMVEDVLAHTIYSDLTLAYMGTFAQYQLMLENSPDDTVDQERRTIIG